jgi:asparagine synthase (glutamine-hydrolysing)
MCGIAGYLTSIAATTDDMCRVVARMSDMLVHRGPDDSGVWADDAAGVALGHRRLSILDLSAQGHQPMTSQCGRYVIVFNGEIYNHIELRQGLSGFNWRGHSDTETILACFSQYGVRPTLHRLVGMFGLAVWDRQSRLLTLARDRMGEKPLYYGRLPCGDFVFASELKALAAHPRWAAEVDRDALALYFRHNVVPAPHSIYRGISKLAPGAWLEISVDGIARVGTYWDLRGVIERGRSDPLEVSDAEAVGLLEERLGAAVRSQMIADVPLGAFLSGGIDSSAVVAMMCQQSTNAVRTFSIGFEEQAFDEAAHAKEVARHLGTQHTEWYVTPADALDVIPRLSTTYDEPFADSSQIPTVLVSQLARRHVAVSLSGDGGDELFAGYNRYLIARRAWRYLGACPPSLRSVAARVALSLSPSSWDAIGRSIARVPGMPRAVREQRCIGDKLHKFATAILPVRNQAEMYRALVSHWAAPSELVIDGREPKTRLDAAWSVSDDAAAVEKMCELDQLTYLPDDILTKVDRAAMSVSLETRVPFLDHRLVEFSWQLPMHQKIRGGQGKWLLRQVLHRHVPQSLVNRPKMGFAVPLDSWLRGPLREWAEALLAADRIRREGFLNVVEVRLKWDEHISGRRNWQYQLWDVLMFQAWLERVRNA